MFPKRVSRIRIGDNMYDHMNNPYKFNEHIKVPVQETTTPQITPSGKKTKKQNKPTNKKWAALKLRAIRILRKQPLRSTDLREQLGYGREGSGGYPLINQLIEAKHIQKSGSYLFPTELGLAQLEKGITPEQLSHTSHVQKVLTFLSQHQGESFTRVTLASHAGITKNQAESAVRTLKERGLLRTESKSGKTWFFLTPKVQNVKLEELKPETKQKLATIAQERITDVPKTPLATQKVSKAPENFDKLVLDYLWSCTEHSKKPELRDFINFVKENTDGN